MSQRVVQRICLLFLIPQLILLSAFHAQGAETEVRLSGLRPGCWCKFVVTSRMGSRAGWIVKDYGIVAVPAVIGSRVKGIAYVPGCALKTFDIAVVGRDGDGYEFQCEPVPQITMLGLVTRLGKRYEHPVTIEAKYVVGWADDFFAYHDGTTTEIPLGSQTTIDDQNRFSLAVPNWKDPGEIRIWVRDQVTHQLVDQLRSSVEETQLPAMRLGGIAVEALKPNQVLRFSPANDSCAHDNYGFSYRSEQGLVCAH